MPEPSQKWANLPNVLTVFRILLIPVLFALLLDPSEESSLLAAFTFWVASVSDFFDGYLARRWGISTTFGTVMDPVADKLIVATALIMLAGMGRAPAWMVIIIIGRELAVTALRGVALAQGLVVAAEELGKYKAVFQVLGVNALLIHYPFLNVDWHSAGMYFLWISLVVGLWSGVDYHVKVIRNLTRGSGSLPAS